MSVRLLGRCCRTASLKAVTRATGRPATVVTSPPVSSRRSAATTARTLSPVRSATSGGLPAPSTTAANVVNRSGSASSPASASGSHVVGCQCVSPDGID